jgi:hypothetical protein
MIPPITQGLSAELVRDGGSLVATFLCANGSEYWLFFKVRLGELPSGQSERLGYEEPQVIERLSGETIAVTWQHAITLLSQIRPLLNGESDLRYLDAMTETAKVSGCMPSAVARVFGNPSNFRSA